MKKIATSSALLGIALFLAVHTQAQLKLKQYWLAGSVLFASGLMDGTIESINYHYEDGFKLRFPKARDHFWNPAVSWKNKYKNQDPAQGPKFKGSTNVFVFTTDAYHLLRATSRTLNGFTLAFYINQSAREKQLSNKQRWLRIGRDFLVLTAIRTAGFHLTYSVLFRKGGL
ncbi:hypothetical protein CNR22_16995 [Sphingobacteriaceae bacterium]|nr:hypothetical protein CNR22_16995 [Sphingobacteriaceae bacterium]